MSQIKTLLDKIMIPFRWFLKASLIKKVAILAIIIGIGWFTVPKVLGQNDKEPQYQTATAARGTLISNVTASGSIATGTNASITTSATGVVKEVYVQNGDTVQQGDTIATLALDQASQQKQASAWSSYLSAQNTLNSAKNQMNALQAALFEANKTFVNGAGKTDPITDDPTYIIQKANWLKAETDYTNQKNVIAQAEAALSSAWLSYVQTSATITAPISGTISNLTLSPGAAISNPTSSTNNSTTTNTQSYGSVVLEGGKVQAIVNLTEIDVTKIKIGQKVTITMDAFPDKTFTGRVLTINTNGSVSSGVTTYPTTIEFDTAEDSVYPNMAVNAQIITNIKSDVILVPNAAVQTANGESTIRVVKDGKATTVSVVVGDANDTETEIISGIQEGDVIITGSSITPATGASTQSGTSPFGNTGFGGGNRRGGGFGGGGAGGAIMIRR